MAIIKENFGGFKLVSAVLHKKFLTIDSMVTLDAWFVSRESNRIRKAKNFHFVAYRTFTQVTNFEKAFFVYQVIKEFEYGSVQSRESKLSSFHLEFSFNSIRYICLLF